MAAGVATQAYQRRGGLHRRDWSQWLCSDDLTGPGHEEATARNLTAQMLRHGQPRGLLGPAAALPLVRDAGGRIGRLLGLGDLVIDRRRMRQALDTRLELGRVFQRGERRPP